MRTRATGTARSAAGEESIQKVKSAFPNILPGAFAENIAPGNYSL